MTDYDVLTETIDCRPDPLQVYKHFFAASESSFLLESSVVIPGCSRFSFAGDSSGRFEEFMKYSVAEKTLSYSKHGKIQTHSAASFFEIFRKIISEKIVPQSAGLPFNFNLGYVGTLGFELKGETIGDNPFDSIGPDAAFLLATRMIVIDHWQGKTYLLHLVDGNGSQEAARWLEKAAVEMPDLGKDAAYENIPKMSLEDVETWLKLNVSARHSRDDYLAKIRSALKSIHNGESYEICMTNMFEMQAPYSPLKLYETLRANSPSPYGGYLRIGDYHLVSASPERFLSIDNLGNVESKPIKGTRPRHVDPKIDAEFADDLRTHEKDRAENLMIVDLLRNDLNQVCKLGSVHVPKIFDVESYSHTHQLVSTIRGQLRSTCDALSCVQAAFPGGSMTGAPKKRTLSIIDELECAPRGTYSGAFGWFSLSGACDLNIVIRSVTVVGDRAFVGVGGAIITLSDPEEEYRETLVKARCVIESIEWCRRGFA